MTPAAARALGQTNDTARLLCLMHEINEGAHAALDVDDTHRPNNIIDAGLALADNPDDDEHTRQHLLYIAAQTVAWLLIIERRKAAA